MHNSWSYLPLWVYPLFILPVIFVLMSINHLDGSPKINWISGLCWVTSLGLGGYLGYLYKRSAMIDIDVKRGSIKMPQDKVMLALILLIFMVELAINVVEAGGPSPQWWFAPLALSVSGFISGMALGRNGVYLYRYFKHSKTSW